MEISKAIIGGFGLLELKGFKLLKSLFVKTPYGYPSNPVQIIFYDGIQFAFLNRYSKDKLDLISNKANIYLLKKLGVKQIIGVEMVGVLDPYIQLTDLVIPDQVMDLTQLVEEQSFFDRLPILMNFEPPICKSFYKFLVDELKTKVKKKIHSGKPYFAINGIFFPTQLESSIYRSWGASIIGIDIVSEMKLAKQAEICYAFLAFATDYDACFSSLRKQSVQIEAIIKENKDQFYGLLRFLLEKWKNINISCSCSNLMRNILYQKAYQLPKAIRNNLKGLYEKYFNEFNSDFSL